MSWICRKVGAAGESMNAGNGPDAGHSIKASGTLGSSITLVTIGTLVASIALGTLGSSITLVALGALWTLGVPVKRCGASIIIIPIIIVVGAGCVSIYDVYLAVFVDAAMDDACSRVSVVGPDLRHGQGT